jgi:hypothetical protein
MMQRIDPETGIGPYTGGAGVEAVLKMIKTEDFSSATEATLPGWVNEFGPKVGLSVEQNRAGPIYRLRVDAYSPPNPIGAEEAYSVLQDAARRGHLDAPASA